MKHFIQDALFSDCAKKRIYDQAMKPDMYTVPSAFEAMIAVCSDTWLVFQRIASIFSSSHLQ